MHRSVLIALLLAALALGACGDDTPTTEREAQTTADEVSAQAREIAQDTRELQEDVVATARSLVDDPDANRERAQERLREQEGRARELADRAQQELPPEEAARDALVEANRRTARAATQLREFAENNRDVALERARAALGQSSDELRAAAAKLRRREGGAEDARRTLEDLREQLPEIPRP